MHFGQVFKKIVMGKECYYFQCCKLASMKHNCYAISFVHLTVSCCNYVD